MRSCNKLDYLRALYCSSPGWGADWHGHSKEFYYQPHPENSTPMVPPSLREFSLPALKHPKPLIIFYPLCHLPLTPIFSRRKPIGCWLFTTTGRFLSSRSDGDSLRRKKSWHHHGGTMAPPPRFLFPSSGLPLAPKSHLGGPSHPNVTFCQSNEVWRVKKWTECVRNCQVGPELVICVVIWVNYILTAVKNMARLPIVVWCVTKSIWMCFIAVCHKYYAWQCFSQQCVV